MDAQAGRVTWIDLRPARLAPLRLVDEVSLTEAGLEGDHGRPGKRAVTLFQAQHLPAVASYVGRAVSPEELRRNLQVSGLNLSSLRGVPLHLGAAAVEITLPCAPCSRMESALGPGGYNALRCHGGWCARVLRPGRIGIGHRFLRADSEHI